jgi:two-component system, LuxR family, response regulator FixJ
MNQTDELPLKNYKMPLVRKQIYIIDNDVSVLRSLKILMDTYGFDVDTFASSDKFFEAVSKSAQGCLILDVHLVGLDGWDTQQKLKKIGYILPVIVISADKSSSFKNKALKAGAVGYLQKPFEDHHLLHLVTLAFKNTKEKISNQNTFDQKTIIP